MSDGFSNIVRSILLKILALVAAVALIAAVSSSKVLPNLFAPAVNPCKQPITYSIGTFDSRFGLSQQEFLNAINEAKGVWEKADGRTLFTYQPDDSGILKISLVYNGLQSQTQDLANLNKQINSNTKSYDQLKAEYDQLRATYQSSKQAYDAALNNYNQQKAEYESQVAYWNSRGGAPDPQYEQLQQQKANLIEQQNQLNVQRQNLDQIATNINAVAAELNSLAATHNSDVQTYNSSGLVGKEFDEGLYIQDDLGRRIEIYQFDNHAKLVRVLAHELGHALGLEHVEDPKAIMYRLNQSQNDTPTQADLKELYALCSKAT